MKNPAEILAEARNAFDSGRTKSYEFRINQLKGLAKFVQENEAAILDVLAIESRKPKFESKISETNMMMNDINSAIFNLKDWMQPELAEKPLTNVLDDLQIHPEPYGVALIVGTWNYPFSMIIGPLVGAIAAGNCAVVKPSEITAKAAALTADLLPKYLDNQCYHVYNGGVSETTALLALKFDYIFYTGSTTVGKIVYKAAAEHLTPVTLELGGKSPVYIDSNADVDIAAARVIWGKCFNGGQSCIAPDYVLCSKDVEKRFIEAAKRAVKKWYPENIKENPDYSRIINENHFKRLVGLIKGSKIAMGGDFDESDRFIEPTIVVGVNQNDPLMQQEIFGPILPILNVENAAEALNFINANEKPLALYVFSSDKTTQNLFLQNTSSGDVLINDVLMHFSCETIPFGGVGNSGIGRYHGKYSFDTFSHKKGVLIKELNKLGEFLNASRYPPYNETKCKFISFMTAKRPSFPGAKIMPKVFVFSLGYIFALATQYLLKYHLKKSQ